MRFITYIIAKWLSELLFNSSKGDVVLMSEDEYEGLIETLDLLSTPGFKEGFEKAKKEVESGDTVSFDEVFGEPL